MRSFTTKGNVVVAYTGSPSVRSWSRWPAPALEESWSPRELPPGSDRAPPQTEQQSSLLSEAQLLIVKHLQPGRKHPASPYLPPAPKRSPRPKVGLTVRASRTSLRQAPKLIFNASLLQL